jgi:hypothetical protein
MFKITKDTTFNFPAMTSALKHAHDIFMRDFEKVFSTGFSQGNDVEIITDCEGLLPEQFRLTVTDENIKIQCADTLGVIYAVMYMSREFLGVDDFWYWTEKEPMKRNMIAVASREYLSPKAKVRYRGWFVNDEVCLIGWSDEYPPSRKVWEIVFETLLRLGGNMVIPGTDLPREGQHFDIASEMGLYITHHHAEPLGAEMFLRAYPDKEASYDKYPDLFEKLWRDAIEKNKDKKIVWTLGFRGQGDAPFWQNDPKYTTPESRAEVIGRVIERQYELICEKVENPVCAVYLYGEITELYEGGYLKLPKKFIKIWSDNGYGKMVVRRRGLHNPRTPSLPKEDGAHGLYYHITFHDLQASSHLTLLGNTIEFVNSSLDESFAAGADTYLLLNCGNIRPHVYMLSLVAEKWNNGAVCTERFKSVFAKKYFGDEDAVICYDDYFDACIKYGEHEDDKAGDEIYYHTARRMCTDWAKGKEKSEGLFFATGDVPFKEQALFFKNKCAEAAEKFSALVEKCGRLMGELRMGQVFFEDNILFQAKLHLSGAKGLYSLCRAREYFEDGDMARCFVTLTQSMEEFRAGVSLLEKSEHDKWKNFYSCDWLTNVRITVYAVDSMRKYIRMISDGPDYFAWYKNYCMPETERQIYLENTQRRTLSDDALSAELKEKLWL